jgi:hypothetical protein
MGRDLALLLAGAAVALSSSLITVLLQHVLALRAEKIKRRLDEEEKAAERSRARLSEGTDIHRALIEKRLTDSIGTALTNISREIGSVSDLKEAVEVLRTIHERESEDANIAKTPLRPEQIKPPNVDRK